MIAIEYEWSAEIEAVARARSQERKGQLNLLE
jgi:hypothetical protein